MSTTLIVATRNKHKVEEIQAILGNCFRFLTLNDFPDAPPVEEDGATFEENATKKAVSLVRWLHSNSAGAVKGSAYVLADDSGLEVDALNGAPGVHSARFAALDTVAPGNSPDAQNNAKLIRLLQNIPEEKRDARFRCVLALTPLQIASSFNESRSVSDTRTFAGACEGRVTTKPGGKGGFGYDPLFIPAGYEASFAELGEQIKNKLSHRAKALEQLRQAFERGTLV